MSSANITVKLVLLGESAVGKSSIVTRQTRNEFQEFGEATIGAAFLTHIIKLEDRTIKFEIWDTAGQERYHSLAPMYYRGAQAAIIVYDITNELSLERAKKWVSELQGNSSQVVIALAGNKFDLSDKRAVDSRDAQSYADEKGLIFMETSAKTNHNIAELFRNVAIKIPLTDPRANANEGNASCDQIPTEAEWASPIAVDRRLHSSTPSKSDKESAYTAFIRFELV